MLRGYRVYDADAHGSISPGMWQDLPEQYRARRPRPVTVNDASGLGNYNAGWLIEGALEPHALGPGAQQANTPRNVLVEFHGAPFGRTLVVDHEPMVIRHFCPGNAYVPLEVSAWK